MARFIILRTFEKVDKETLLKRVDEIKKNAKRVFDRSSTSSLFQSATYKIYFLGFTGLRLLVWKAKSVILHKRCSVHHEVAIKVNSSTGNGIPNSRNLSQLRRMKIDLYCKARFSLRRKVANDLDESRLMNPRP